ncbi:MAG: hypothetical protein CMB79_17620 [Filomicrobium sp.]|nr:hypothetical protein [Filomicrobium sp.]
MGGHVTIPVLLVSRNNSQLLSSPRTRPVGDVTLTVTRLHFFCCCLGAVNFLQERFSFSAEAVTWFTMPMRAEFAAWLARHNDTSAIATAQSVSRMFPATCIFSIVPKKGIRCDPCQDAYHNIASFAVISRNRVPFPRCLQNAVHFVFGSRFG